MHVPWTINCLHSVVRVKSSKVAIVMRFHYTVIVFTCSILNEALACQGAHISIKRQITMVLTCTHPVCSSGFLEPCAQPP